MRLTSTVEVRLSGWVSSTTTLCMTLRDILQSQETTGIQPCFDCSGRRLSAPPSGAVKARLSKLHNVVVLGRTAALFETNSSFRSRDSSRCLFRFVYSLAVAQAMEFHQCETIIHKARPHWIV